MLTRERVRVSQPTVLSNHAGGQCDLQAAMFNEKAEAACQNSEDRAQLAAASRASVEFKIEPGHHALVELPPSTVRCRIEIQRAQASGFCSRSRKFRIAH